MMPDTRILLAALLFAAASTACTPEPLLGLDGDAGVDGNNMMGPDAAGGEDGGNGGGGGDIDADMMTGDTGGTNNAGPSEEFMEVARIMTSTSQGCLLAGCHGDTAASGVNFRVGGGMLTDNPSEELATELYDVLMTVDAANGTPLIVPFEPGSSEVYIRITSAEEYPVGMPPLPLPQADIDTIANWIAAGAEF